MPDLVQRQIGGDDQRLPAAVAAVYDVVDPLDAGCAIASLKVDRKVHHDLAQGERGSLVKNTNL